MHAKGQRKVVVFGYAFIIAALLCAAGYVSSGGCGRSGSDTARGNGERTTEQVNRATEYNRQAGAEVRTAAGAVERAEQHADSAASLNRQAQAGVNDSQKLVEQIRADNRRAKQIIDELIAGAQAGAAQDRAH